MPTSSASSIFSNNSRSASNDNQGNLSQVSKFPAAGQKITTRQRPCGKYSMEIFFWKFCLKKILINFLCLKIFIAECIFCTNFLISGGIKCTHVVVYDENYDSSVGCPKTKFEAFKLESQAYWPDNYPGIPPLQVRENWKIGASIPMIFKKQLVWTTIHSFRKSSCLFLFSLFSDVTLVVF